MRKLMKESQTIFVIGVLGFDIANYSESLYLISILIPIFLLTQFIGVVLMIKNLFTEERSNTKVKSAVLGIVAIIFGIISFVANQGGYSVVSVYLASATTICALIVAWCELAPLL